VKEFRIFYKWAGRQYETIVPAANAAWAVFMAPVQLMNGARVIGVEVAR